MKEKFTKQEWKVADGTKVGEQVLFVHAPEIGGVICRLTHTANPNIPLSEADIANAHLIAAAPKMYAMLDRLHAHLDNDDTDGLAFDIRELLAEARGEL